MKRRVLFIIAGVLVVAVGAVLVLRDGEPSGSKAKAAGKGAPSERKVPVLVETVQRRDVPIVIEGLGTVTPLATVQVRSQVDGRLQKVFFKEGQVVKQGDALALIDPRPFQIAILQATATLQRDQAALRNAKLLLERNTTLHEQNLVPRQIVDDQQTAVDQLTGTTGIDEAALASARLQLDFANVKSPIDGVVGIRQIDPGNLVRASDATGLVVVTQLDPISVMLTVPQDELERLQRAMNGALPAVEAWSRDGSKLLGTGTLQVIDNQVNASTGTLKLRAQFDNPARALWPNQFVKARLTVETVKDALVVPAAAVQRGPKGAFVYVVNESEQAEQRAVEVELITGQTAVLQSGVEAEERVVIDGQAQLKPQSPVEIRPSAPVTGQR